MPSNESILALAHEALKNNNKQALAELNDLFEDSELDRVEKVKYWGVRIHQIADYRTAPFDYNYFQDLILEVEIPWGDTVPYHVFPHKDQAIHAVYGHWKNCYSSEEIDEYFLEIMESLGATRIKEDRSYPTLNIGDRYYQFDDDEGYTISVAWEFPRSYGNN